MKTTRRMRIKIGTRFDLVDTSNLQAKLRAVVVSDLFPTRVRVLEDDAILEFTDNGLCVQNPSLRLTEKGPRN